MALIIPFKGIIYNKEKVGNISRVVAPPYDIIPPNMQRSLYSRDPHNVVRLILGKSGPDDNAVNNRYTRAAKFFDAWLKGKIMITDKEEAIYIYSQTYRDRGRDIERLGFISLMKLNLDEGKGALSHENTLLAPKEDRLKLIRQVKANLSPIFMLYEDKGHGIVRILRKMCANERPFIDIGFEDVRHRVWRMRDAGAIKKIERLMKPKELFIADGHHRYEVAVNYHREVMEKSSSKKLRRNSGYMMAYFVESDERMLTVLASHRIIKDICGLTRGEIIERLSQYFSVERSKSLADLVRKLGTLKRSPHVFGMYSAGGYYLLKIKNPRESDRAIKGKPAAWKRLSVAILHLFVIQHILGVRDDDDNVEFSKNAAEAVRLADKAGSRLVFFLNPTLVSQVKDIAKLGERMPRKATYFYPKPLSGLVINKLD